MATKLTLTPTQQALVDEMLEAEHPILAASPGPVPPLGRNAGLARLVTASAARANGIAARAARFTNPVKAALGLKRNVIRRYGLLGAIIKRFYWKVSWHELAFRTERKYHLTAPAYWKEVS